MRPSAGHRFQRGTTGSGGERPVSRCLLPAIGRETLEIKLLNEKLVDDELKKSAELTRALLEHKENKNLFVNPVKFRRIK